MNPQINEDQFSIAIFPFLKTYEPFKLGGFTFRSTKDIEELLPEQAKSVSEIADMLFLKDDLKIESATYAIVPFIDMENYPIEVTQLQNIQSIVAYLYSSPHEIFGDIFLSSEHASMALFSPGLISIYLARPERQVISIQDFPDLSPDKFGRVIGYWGLYNFRHHFWVVPGSRVYGPNPHITLNLSQDLSSDLLMSARKHHQFKLLLHLLEKPISAISSRFFTAIKWYNIANREINDEDAALVNLAIAFESLLGLPEGEKTERLVDTIALLLGRIPRLDVWAKQFYDARSRIVHEGRTQQLRFIASDTRKYSEGQIYQSLLSYGRQIFRLCLGTLLIGAGMAESAGLEDKLVTNQERFEKICKVLSDDKVEPCQRLANIGSIVKAIDLYRFVSESGLRLETLIGVTRLSAKSLIDCNDSSPSSELRKKLEAIIIANRTSDHFEELDAIRKLDEILPDDPVQAENQPMTVTREIVKVVWHYVFMHYFWLQDQRARTPNG